MLNNDYSLLLKQIEALLESETDPIANAANLSALIYRSVPRLNWSGFYFINPKSQQLVLGPFHGEVACTRIDIGKGVCGTAYAKQQTIVVADVHQFEGHIACDAASESEIVVPFTTDIISGVLDIDSPEKNRFSETDKDFFESVVSLYCAAIS